MRLYLLAYCVLACDVVVQGFFNKFISRGRWIVDRLEKCLDDETYVYHEEQLHKRKLNRTHDVFYGELEILEDMRGDEVGISIVACKQVDGGCRPVAVFGDKNVCRFFSLHAKENYVNFLNNIGAGHNCFLRKGKYRLNDFLFDNREIPEVGIVGEFMATVVFTKHGGVNLFCIAIYVHLAEKDEDE